MSTLRRTLIRNTLADSSMNFELGIYTGSAVKKQKGLTTRLAGHLIGIADARIVFSPRQPEPWLPGARGQGEWQGGQDGWSGIPAPLHPLQRSHPGASKGEDTGKA